MFGGYQPIGLRRRPPGRADRLAEAWRQETPPAAPDAAPARYRVEDSVADAPRWATVIVEPHRIGRPQKEQGPLDQHSPIGGLLLAGLRIDALRADDVRLGERPPRVTDGRL